MLQLHAQNIPTLWASLFQCHEKKKQSKHKKNVTDLGENSHDLFMWNEKIINYFEHKFEKTDIRIYPWPMEKKEKKASLLDKKEIIIDEARFIIIKLVIKIKTKKGIRVMAKERKKKEKEKRETKKEKLAQ